MTAKLFSRRRGDGPPSTQFASTLVGLDVDPFDADGIRNPDTLAPENHVTDASGADVAMPDIVTDIGGLPSEAPDPADAPTLSHIGRYALKHQLGAGGLGAVFEAWDPLLSRAVAVKTLQFNVDHSARISLDGLFLNEARAAAKQLGGEKWVVKAQVHAGGRGKAGGVKLVTTHDAVEEAAKGMLGKKLVTKQTDKAGLPINSVWVEKPSGIARELYVAGLVDRTRERIVFMASADGGMDIEEVAHNTPERIKHVYVNPAAGLQPFQARQLGFFMGLNKEQTDQFTKILTGLYRIMTECDAGLIEINPLIVTNEGNVFALDAKVNFDANALYRQKEIAAMRDPSQEDEAEREASKFDLNYVTLEGNIGCMVNGAGLAMATMDIVKLHGGQPANFLDVGGGTTAEKVTEAFKLITKSPDVKAIFINIFGGIVRCDLIAEGIISACKQTGLKIPVVARLQGTNMEKGRELLEKSGLAITPVSDLTEAAKTVVALAK